MSRHDIVTQYIMFTRILAEQEKLYGRTQKAITETIRICKDRNVLKEYLEKKEQEVITIMKSLFSQEDAMKEYGDEREIKGAVNLARKMNMTERQIEDYLVETFKITREEAEKYLEPVSA